LVLFNCNLLFITFPSQYAFLPFHRQITSRSPVGPATTQQTYNKSVFLPKGKKTIIMGLCCRGTHHLSPCRLLRVLIPVACGGMHEKWFRVGRGIECKKNRFLPIDCIESETIFLIDFRRKVSKHTISAIDSGKQTGALKFDF